MKRVLIIPLSLLLLSCQTVNYAAQIAGAVGIITPSQADAISETAVAGEKAMEEITPSQEYYIGRAVGATVLNQYSVWDSKKATAYLNKLTKLLAYNSDRPEIFGGYHLLILDSDEINAFATPGGHIFISRGMLKLTTSEDELAAIIAHEISHIVLKHGLSAIKKSRVTNFLTVLGTNAAKELTSEEISSLTTMFEDSISDITQTLVNSGYSRASEKEADQMTIEILEKTGYHTGALNNVLYRMNRHLTPGALDFAKTHPDPMDRIEDIETESGVLGYNHPLRSYNRFNDFMELLDEQVNS